MAFSAITPAAVPCSALPLELFVLAGSRAQQFAISGWPLDGNVREMLVNIRAVEETRQANESPIGPRQSHLSMAVSTNFSDAKIVK